METITLKRTYYKDFTIGVLSGNKIKKDIFILELPNKDNKKEISCIPEGKYIIKKHTSPKYGDTFWIQNVPNRSEVLIHSGNSVRNFISKDGIKRKIDSKGCLLCGFVKDESQGLVFQSKDALKYLLETLNFQNELIIVS